jgi:hypothetical protein
MTITPEDVLIFGSLAILSAFSVGFFFGYGTKESLEFKRIQTRRENRIYTKPPNPNRFNHHL